MGDISNWAAPIGGTLLGIGLAGYNDSRQLEQQNDLMNIQVAGNQRMMDYSMKKQLEMWHATNYQAQKDELKKAGLNPGLLYGMSGGGGVTTGSPGGSVTGGQAPAGGHEIMDVTNNLLQQIMMKAQIANVEADTKVKEGEAANKPIQGENIAMSTASLGQGIKNAKQQEMVLNAEANIKNMEAALKFRTFDAATNYIELQAEEAAEKVKQAVVKTGIDQATAKSQIEIVQREAILASLKNTLTRAEIKLTNAQTGQTIAQTGLTQEQTKLASDYIHTQILQRNKMNWDDANTKEFLKQLGLQTEYNTDIGKDIIKGLTGSISTIIGLSEVLPKVPTGTKPPEVKGFRQ